MNHALMPSDQGGKCVLIALLALSNPNKLIFQFRLSHAAFYYPIRQPARINPLKNNQRRRIHPLNSSKDLLPAIVISFKRAAWRHWSYDETIPPLDDHRNPGCGDGCLRPASAPSLGKGMGRNEGGRQSAGV
jgi:hypothetical protein